MKKKLLVSLTAFLLFLILPAGLLGQTTYHYCYINTFYSADSSHYMVSVPYDDVLETTVGKTAIFRADSVKLYEMDRHFDSQSAWYKVFLSNDGATIVYLVNREYSWEGVKVPAFQMFKHGKAFRQYELSDLIDCDDEKEHCYLFYDPAPDSLHSNDDFRMMIYKKPAFVENDTLYILSYKEELLKISLNTGDYTSVPFSSMNWSWYKQVPAAKVIVNKAENSSKKLPYLVNGQSFPEGLADYLDMRLLTDNQQYNPKFNKYKQYHIEVVVTTDKNGNATLEKDSRIDDVLFEKVKAFVEQSMFQYKGYPEEAERWRSNEWIVMVNKSRKKAMIERQQELKENKRAYERRIVADSIEGQYIPANLEECFIELNKILKEKDVETIRQLSSRDETIRYHHGFGMWLRNNWGLWGGSRLQVYLIDRGVNHPDYMSSLILKYYYDWLHGNHDGWKQFDKKGIQINDYRLPDKIWIRDIYRSPWTTNREYYYTLKLKNDKYRIFKAYIENGKILYKNRYAGKIDTIRISIFVKLALSDTTLHFHFNDFADVFTDENANAFIQEHGPNHWLRTEVQKKFVFDEITNPRKVEKNLHMYYGLNADQSGWIDGASTEISVRFPFGEKQLVIQSSSIIEYALPININGQDHYNPELSRMLKQILPKNKNYRQEQLTGKTLHYNLTREVLNTYSKSLENIEALNYQWVTDSLERYFKVIDLSISNSIYSINWNGGRRYCCQLWDPENKYDITVTYSCEIENNIVKYSPDSIINDYPQLVSKIISVDFFRQLLADSSNISIIYDNNSCFTSKTKENFLRDYPEGIDFANSLLLYVQNKSNSNAYYIILPDNRYFLWKEL